MLITYDYSSGELLESLWSGALLFYEKLNESDQDTVLTALETYYNEMGETPTITEINDLLWFETNFVLKLCLEYGYQLDCLIDGLNIAEELPEDEKDSILYYLETFQLEEFLYLTVWS